MLDPTQRWHGDTRYASADPRFLIAGLSQRSGAHAWQGWELETPGGRFEFHAPKDYGGKRVIIKKEFLGKSKPLDLRLLGSPEEYAKVQAVPPHPTSGAVRHVLSLMGGCQAEFCTTLAA